MFKWLKLIDKRSRRLNAIKKERSSRQFHSQKRYSVQFIGMSPATAAAIREENNREILEQRQKIQNSMFID